MSEAKIPPLEPLPEWPVTPVISAEDFACLRESVARAREEMEHALYRAERAHEEIRLLQSELAHQQQGRRFTLVVILLLLIGTAAYVFFALRGQETQALSLPATRGFQASLHRIEAMQENDHKKLIALEQGLAPRILKDSPVSEVVKGTYSESVDLKESPDANRHDVSGSPNPQAKQQRVDFEVQNERSNQLMPGLALTLVKLDMNRQLLDGYLQFAGETRSVLLRQQGILRPLLVRNRKNQPYELVFTKINRGGAAGYILVPPLSASLRSHELTHR